jgi:hypothetical protein
VEGPLTPPHESVDPVLVGLLRKQRARGRGTTARKGAKAGSPTSVVEARWRVET